MKRFQDRIVIVTGASAGIGAAAARRFAAEGARLLLAARGREALEAIAAETGGEAVPTDIGDPEDCRRLIERAAALGGPHVLVNNAAAHARGDFPTIPLASLERMVRINLEAPVRLCHLVVPAMLAAGGGTVVNVASLAGCAPVPGAATYSGTKAGLRAFTRALDEELRPRGVRFTLVSPGPVATGFILDGLEEVAPLALSQPMIEADEVAEAIVASAWDGRLERRLPVMSGLLTDLGYLFPRVLRALRPSLEARGRRAKERLLRARR